MSGFWLAGNRVLAAACDRKNRYVTERGARFVAKERLRKDASLPRLYVYACAQCRGWHLTKTENSAPAVTAHEQYEGVGL